MSTQIQESETETETEETSEHQTRRLAEKRERADMAERAETDLSGADETARIKVFRYDPEVEGKKDPRFDTFEIPFIKGMTVLDALIYARDHFDSSLTFRHSCRQAICGSDALFINGRQRLGCKTQMVDLEWPVQIEPLPHAEVVKDLVVDMEHFYDQMEKMSTRCIWCSACMSSCNIAAGDNKYLGPAAINKAYRFAMDHREGEDMKEHRINIIEQEHGVWRCQTQFSCTEVCPKDIPLTEHIQELKREAVKSNLKFW